MKKILFFSFVLILTSCSNKEENVVFKLLPIHKSTTPKQFTFGKIDTISVKYLLPSKCYAYHSLYYQYKDTTRTVAIRALHYLDKNCPDTTTVVKELKIPINVKQRKNYLFRFWKGKDSKGKDTFEEKVVLVK